MRAGQSSHVYTIACPRDFFAAWLSARLAGFRQSSPHLRFALIGGDGDIDFAEANLDLAVRWSEGPGDLEGIALGPTGTLVVAGPDTPDDAPWIAWPGDPAGDDAGAGADEGARTVHISVGDAGTAISAAAAGLGRARVPRLLGEAALATGRVRLLGLPEDGRRGYWLVAPLPQWRQKKVRALIAALQT
jgi:LysR family glycine cleavage system transcriptional activator